MKIKTNCYGVLLGLAKRHPFIATDGKGAPAIFDSARRARDYRDELAAHALKGKVVKVHVMCALPPNDP